MRSSTGVRLWPGLRAQHLRVQQCGCLGTRRAAEGPAASDAAVRRDKRVGAGIQWLLIDVRRDKQRLAVGEPPRYTGAAAVLQRGNLMSGDGAGRNLAAAYLPAARWVAT